MGNIDPSTNMLPVGNEPAFPSAKVDSGVIGNLTPRYFGIPVPNYLDYSVSRYQVYTSPWEILHPLSERSKVQRLDSG